MRRCFAVAPRVAVVGGLASFAVLALLVAWQAGLFEPRIQRLVRKLQTAEAPEDRHAAARELGEMGAEARPAAKSSGADTVSESHEQRIGAVPVSGLRFDAAGAMARMGPLGEVAIPTLVEMLEKPGESVKTYLDGKRVGAPEAEGYAALLYRRNETGVYIDQRDRYLINVIRCLANFGPAARDAAPAIETVRDDPNSLASVVEMATETLMVIQGEGTE